MLRHFEIEAADTPPPQETGWERTWHGKYEMTKCESAQRRLALVERDRAIRAEGMMTEAEFERDCFLSILAEIKTTHVNMLELGAGWGRMCLALAGVIDYRAISLTPVSYRCLAVEGEPAHCEWIREHFETQKINGTVVHGAVSKGNGTCYFGLPEPPDVSYGQAMSPMFHRYKIPNLRNLLSVITGKAVKVPMYTIDELMRRYDFKHVSIVDVDVQGAEYEVVLGAAESIERDLIDYWLIGTHHPRLNEVLRLLLSPSFDLIVDLYPNSIGQVDGFAPVSCHDGVQLFRRRNIAQSTGLPGRSGRACERDSL